jgi:hypothetical protein
MTDEIQRSIRHEAGHATAALHLGFQVQRISVSKGIPFCEILLGTPDRTQHERYIVLAGGIAAERFFYRTHHPEACREDNAMIAKIGGRSIETYLPEALGIMNVNKCRLRGLVWKLMCRMEDELGADSFDAGGRLETAGLPSFDLLLSEDIQSVWLETGSEHQ